jgi:hypothetical protein
MDQLKALVKELHSESYNNKCTTGEHVHMVFADGEYALTKGGSLFGFRTLHCIATAICPDQRFADCFPMTYNGFKFAFVADEIAVNRIRDAIKGLLGQS